MKLIFFLIFFVGNVVFLKNIIFYEIKNTDF